MKRDAGWTWVQAVLADPWSKDFKGMKSEHRTRAGLCLYLREGGFTDKQKESWLGEVRRIYEIKCLARGVKPCPFPPSLQKQITKLRSK